MSNSFSFEDELDASIDLTPLIDTVFMLLIFFIMATTFSKPVLEVALQSAEGAVVKEVKKEPVCVSLSGAGLFFLGEREVSLAEIEMEIAGSEKEQGVVFNVDKNAPFGSFVWLVDLAKKHGKVNIAINAAGHEKVPHATK